MSAIAHRELLPDPPFTRSSWLTGTTRPPRLRFLADDAEAPEPSGVSLGLLGCALLVALEHGAQKYGCIDSQERDPGPIPCWN